MKKLEVYYLANKSENIYFALLGDCTSSKNEVEKFDDEVIKAGLEETEKLNKKYIKNFDDNIPKFNFLYRKRTWNPSEKCYLGWERKRGLLCEFNDFLVNGNNPFRINTLVGVGVRRRPVKQYQIRNHPRLRHKPITRNRTRINRCNVPHFK